MMFCNTYFCMRLIRDKQNEIKKREREEEKPLNAIDK